ncbi:MAG TPA: protein kinase [Chthoniobacterales bacterium]|nr:protein kinase [Chthoniobacterales bacterium]
MLPDVFLDQYRISKAADGTPMEVARNGPAITYKASDLKSGAPVTLTVVPTISVDPAERERFEQKARTAMLLDHVNVAKTVAFGAVDDSLVFVSEYPLGESVDAWVKVHGPMPADAVLRVALQIVSALGAASFHGLNHPAIQPANIVIVTGKTAEGGWPLVKLTHFALSGLKSAPGHAEPDVSASDYASPEQLLQGQVDFRSEIYSLGATMCFLLTGIFYSAYPRSPQTKRFRGPLRKLVARMLEDDPASRPQDPVRLTEELRNCLVAVERRQRLQRQYGFPVPEIVKKPKRLPRFQRRARTRPVPLLAPVGVRTVADIDPDVPVVSPARRLRPSWAIVAGLLALGLIAALVLPEDVVTAAFHRNRSPETIGVPIGVPDSSPTTVAAVASKPSLAVTEKPEAATGAASTTAAFSQNKNSAQAPSTAAGSDVAVASSPQPAAEQKDSLPPSPQPISESAGSEVATNAAPSNQSETTVAQVDRSPASATSAPASPSQVAVKSDPVAPAPSSSEPTPAVVVANNAQTREPIPPAEAPSERTDVPQSESSDPNQTAESTATENTTESGLTENKPVLRPGSRLQKSRTKKPVVTQKRTTPRQRVPRALPVEPGSPPVETGSFRARVVGITPNGNVILALPNGERAIVSPQDADQYSRDGGSRRRPRRVIIERRIIVPPQPSQFPPYQPFMPPGT